MSIKLTATKRNITGTSDSRRLRASGNVTAIIYGKSQDNINIYLDHEIVNNTQSKDSRFFERNEPITIDIDGQEVSVFVQDIQRHAFKPKIIHLDFIRP